MLRAYTLAIDKERSGQVLKTRTHEQQHLTTATDDQQQPPTISSSHRPANERTRTVLAVL
ncbi:MAG: hypothetical protein H7Y37_19785 [Anaerolineae bacterium]|nr:hypothetical protein [Gloeobacterales cyanobacterium ES-bin-313]